MVLSIISILPVRNRNLQKIYEMLNLLTQVNRLGYTVGYIFWNCFA